LQKDTLKVYGDHARHMIVRRVLWCYICNERWVLLETWWRVEKLNFDNKPARV